MEFKSIKISNFRNFENIEIALNNKNVFFGMNDVGKTNFLYALRYVFDRDVRKKNLIDTDFYRKNTDNPIEITICIDISDYEDSDSEKLRAQVKGAIMSNQNSVYIKLRAEYNRNEMFANPILYWGGDEKDLQEIAARGYTFDIDRVFNVVYIDAYVNLYSLFNKHASALLQADNENEYDKSILMNIGETIKKLNEDIATLSGVKNFEGKVLEEYKRFRNDKVAISVESEIAVSGLYSNVVPYIKKGEDNALYPTSGEGRKKLLAYSIYCLLVEKLSEQKINLFLIEEPENHLHKSMQLALSKSIFESERYKYTFLTTHSSFILSEMDQVNLVRIYNETKVDSKSVFYTVPSHFREQKRRLNKDLSEAIFADKVLLVEGDSEEVLFEKILSTKYAFYEADGIYILKVNGIGFKPYIKILRQLNIPCVVKTDNDLRKSKESKYEVIGFRRVNEIIKMMHNDKGDYLPSDDIEDPNADISKVKRDIYELNRDKLDSIRQEFHIYLSRVSLEEDLDEVIHQKMNEYLDRPNEDAVSYLQKSKKYRMIELVKKLTEEDCQLILNHDNFFCLKEI